MHSSLFPAGQAYERVAWVPPLVYRGGPDAVSSDNLLPKIFDFGFGRVASWALRACDVVRWDVHSVLGVLNLSPNANVDARIPASRDSESITD
jgi:hypothetical protein